MRTFIIILAVLCCLSCGRGGAKVELTPSQTIEAFHHCIARGEYEGAYGLCDSLSMREYIENYRLTVNELQKRDSSATAIAAGLLEGAEFAYTKDEKAGSERIIHYTLTVGDRSINKIATMIREEGEWKVRAITDAI